MNKKEKILICGILPPPYFGHSMMYKMLIESTFVDVFEVIFINMQFWTYEHHKKVTLTKLAKMAGYYFQFISLLIIKRPQYILFNMSFDKMPFAKDFLFCATGILLGKKIIVHDMGQYIQELHESLSGPGKKALKWMMRHVEASIVLGKTTKGVYRGFMDLERVYVVPGSVYDSKDLPVAPRAQNGKFDVLYFSYLSVSKGIWTALKAMPEVVSRNPNVRFIFAGPAESDELMEEVLSFVRSNRLENHFEYRGYIGDDQQRTECFRNADLFIFPTHRDVFGLVLLHAMAEGCPIIAAKEGAIPEIIEDGVSGALIEKKNHGQLAGKILEIAGKQDIRKAFGSAARSRYQQMFTPESYGQRMIETINLISGQGHPSL